MTVEVPRKGFPKASQFDDRAHRIAIGVSLRETGQIREFGSMRAKEFEVARRHLIRSSAIEEQQFKSIRVTMETGDVWGV